MAHYTTEIRTLQEMKYDFGLKKYPIFKEEYRAELNKKILDHYRFREIGFETAGRFKFALNARMNEIMPYYNQLYDSKWDDYDILSNYSMDEENSETRDSQGTAKGSTKSKGESSDSGTSENKIKGTNTTKDTGTTTLQDDTTGLKVNSETPAGNITLAKVNSNFYATSLDRDQGTGTHTNTLNTTTSNTNDTTNAGSDSRTLESESSVDNDSSSTDLTKTTYERKVKGNTGLNPLAQIKRMRELFVNIDQMIIDELADLFMGVV